MTCVFRKGGDPEAPHRRYLRRMHGKASWKNACTYHRPWFCASWIRFAKDAVRSEFSPIHTTKRVDDRSSIPTNTARLWQLRDQAPPVEKACFFFTWTIRGNLYEQPMWPPWWGLYHYTSFPGTGVVVEMRKGLVIWPRPQWFREPENGPIKRVFEETIGTELANHYYILGKTEPQKLNWTGHWYMDPVQIYSLRSKRPLEIYTLWHMLKTSLSHTLIWAIIYILWKAVDHLTGKRKGARGGEEMRLFPDLNNQRSIMSMDRKCQLGWPIITWACWNYLERKRLRMISSVKPICADIMKSGKNKDRSTVVIDDQDIRAAKLYMLDRWKYLAFSN